MLGAAPAWVGAMGPNAATPDEVVSKVHEAAKYLHDKGQAGFPDFNNNANWVWKDSYVFVFSCRDNKMIAHPLRPDLVGKPILQMEDDKGNLLFKSSAKPVTTPVAVGSNTGGRNRAKPRRPARFPIPRAPKCPSNRMSGSARGSMTRP